MFAVVVTITLKPGTTERFLPMIRANARASLHEENGCHQFDVATDPARQNEVFLYELYTDAAAFAEHLETAHFAQFETEATEMIAEKSVKTFATVLQ